MSYREITRQCSQVGGFNYAHYFTLYVKLNNRDHNAGESSSWVDYNVYCQSSGAGSIRANHQLYFEIDGKVIRNENIYVNVSSPNALIQIASGSVKIWHDANGDKQTWVAAHIQATGGYGVSASIGEGCWLDHIDRGISTSISERKRTSKTLSFNWATNHARDWTQYSVNDFPWTDAGDTVAGDRRSGYFTIPNLQPSTSYRVKIRCKRADTQIWGESGYLTLQTRPTLTPKIDVISKTASKIEVTAVTPGSVSSTRYRIKSMTSAYGEWQTSGVFNNLQFNTPYLIEAEVTATDGGEKFTNTLAVITHDIARISSFPAEWNVEDTINLTISNPGNCQLQLYISYNDIEVISRNNLQLLDNDDYELTLTTDEKNLLYSQAASDTDASFKFILKSYESSKLGEDVVETKILFLTKCWVKINNIWKRALIWGRVNSEDSWKQMLSWVRPNKDEDWKRN